MNRTLPLLAATALLATPLALSARDAAWSSDERRVREAVGHYLRGHATGSPAELRQAFHPEMRMQWVRDGRLQQRTAAEYIAGASGRPAEDEARRRRSISSVDVTGDAAVAKVVLDYPQARITDYLSLLRVDGQWRVVAKTFHSQPRAGQ